MLQSQRNSAEVEKENAVRLMERETKQRLDSEWAEKLKQKVEEAWAGIFHIQYHTKYRYDIHTIFHIQYHTKYRYDIHTRSLFHLDIRRTTLFHIIVKHKI